MAKKITIDSLAEMIDKGFAGVDKNFEGVNKRLDGIDARLDRIENVLIKRHDEEIADLKRRMARLEESLAVK